MQNVKYWIVILSFSFVTVLVIAQTIELQILNVKSEEGQICVGIFESEEAFKKEKPSYEKFYPKSQFCSLPYTIKINVKPGTYGVSVLDDINNDGRVNYNLIGIPTEGFGFGGYYHKGLKKPNFNAFAFEIGKDEHIKLEVQLRYFEFPLKK